MPKSDPVDALTCNCDAENVHIRWDFGGAWEAIILQGAKRGSVFKTIVPDFTEEVAGSWSQCEVRHGFRERQPRAEEGSVFHILGETHES